MDIIKELFKLQAPGYNRVRVPQLRAFAKSLGGAALSYLERLPEWERRKTI